MNLKTGQYRIIYKVFMEYSLKGHFCYKQGSYGVVYSMVHSSQIREWQVGLSFSIRQWHFQGINVDPVMNPSLKSIKGSLHLECKWLKILQESKKIFKVKL